MMTIKYQALSFSGHSLGIFKNRDEAKKAAGFNGRVRQEIINTYSQKRSVGFSWEQEESK